ncbi:MAG TPA: hypothetical protein VIU62_20380, partial [Chloroflexota bacterium]
NWTVEVMTATARQLTRNPGQADAQYGKPPLSHAFVDSIHLESVFNPILNNSLWTGQVAVSTALTNVQTGVAAALAPNAGKHVCVTASATGVC